MISRRRFLGATALVATAGVAEAQAASPTDNDSLDSTSAVRPIVVSTWQHGIPANVAAWKILQEGGRAIDAVEAGVRVSESDPNITSVGYGGWPDAEGTVTLDACIMDETGNCGSVACMKDIENPISVARLVMDKTPHAMLVGEGAKQFALANGFTTKQLLTENSRLEWKKWKAQSPNALNPRQPNIENHDTIGMVAIDAVGKLSGACTTSGMAWKMPGRVGDSPIIGAGLYVDDEIGAATATGVGEAVIRAVGSFLVVELMRQGRSPMDACREAVERVIQKNADWKEFQVGFVAVNKLGQFGAYAIQPEFDFAVFDSKAGNRMIKSGSKIER